MNSKYKFSVKMIKIIIKDNKGQTVLSFTQNSLKNNMC